MDQQDQSLQIGKETKKEIVGLRGDTGKHLDSEFAEIRKEFVSIRDALAGRASRSESLSIPGHARGHPRGEVAPDVPDPLPSPRSSRNSV